jgi:L-gulono-1,4-lactone dehydrogenase
MTGPEGELHATNEERVAEVVRDARERGVRLRTAGSGGSKSDVTSPKDRLLHLEQSIDRIEVDGNLVTAPAEMTNGRLLELLAPHGLTLPTVGEWKNATLAGAFSTGTHGGSARHGIMSTSLREIRLVDGRGEIVTLRPGDPDFRHAGVNLGLLGVITRVTFACERTFSLRLDTDVIGFDEYLRDPFAQESRTEFHASVWEPNARRVIRFGADRIPAGRSPIAREMRFGYRTAITTFMARRLGLHAAVSPRFFRRTAYGDPSEILAPVDVSPKTARFRVLANGVFRLAAEFAVDASRLGDILSRFEAFFRKNRRGLRNPIGLRLSARDDFSLSPATGRDTLWMDVFFLGKERFVRELAELAVELDARTHWGKTLLLSPESIRPQYPEWDAFREAHRRFDPDGVFANAFTDRYGLTDPRESSDDA